MHEWYGYGSKYYGRYDRFCYNCPIGQHHTSKKNSDGSIVRDKKGMGIFGWVDYEPDELDALVKTANEGLRIGREEYQFKKQLQQDMLSDDYCEELLP